MKSSFGKAMVSAAAAGLLGVACGGSTAEPATPEAASEDAAQTPSVPAGNEATAEVGAAGAAGGEKACCKGLNDCSGKGGCATATNTCAGKNTCKGKGGCNMHCPK